MIDHTLLDAVAARFAAARRWVVAYSGGIDSHVLLHLSACWRAARAGTPEVVALHVNHRVQDAAAQWALHCQSVCDALGVRCEVRELAVDVNPSEAHLRAARYRVFEDFCREEDLLLLAHHRDDQAETVLLRLVRGAGPRGLGGMPSARPIGRAWLCRPLLGSTRREVREYATCHDLSWVDDPSNASLSFDRNFMRQRVLPLMAARWPGVEERIARAADNCVQAARLCEDVARSDVGERLRRDRFGQDSLPIAALEALPGPRADNLLRGWLEAGAGRMVDAAALATVRAEVIGSRADAGAEFRIGARRLRRFRDALYLVDAPVRRPPVDDIPVEPGCDQHIPGVGRVRLACGRGSGVRTGGSLMLGFRRGGESCRPAGRTRKPLKKLLQEYEVPPWLRDRVPLLFVDGELAAVGGLFVCEGFSAGPGEPSLRLEWSLSD